MLWNRLKDWLSCKIKNNIYQIRLKDWIIKNRTGCEKSNCERRTGGDGLLAISDFSRFHDLQDK